jgi:hypothetical protein
MQNFSHSETTWNDCVLASEPLKLVTCNLLQVFVEIHSCEICENVLKRGPKWAILFDWNADRLFLVSN